jgi:hypothetical protein
VVGALVSFGDDGLRYAELTKFLLCCIVPSTLLPVTLTLRQALGTVDVWT